MTDNISIRQPISITLNSDVILRHSQTLKQRVFAFLEKDHELKPKDLCKLMDLSYAKHGNSIAHCKTLWRYDFKNRHSLKCLKFHRARGWLYAFNGLDRSRAVGSGWRRTEAKNRMLVWVSDPALGRVEWFETGRINVFVRKPATKGKALQLLAKAFCWTGLIESQAIFGSWVETLRFKGAHLTLDTGERVPYAVVEFLKDSNGVIFRAGDVSHPTSYELEFCLPDWAEKMERLAEARLQLDEKLLLTQGKEIEARERFTEALVDFTKPKLPKVELDRSFGVV